MSSLSSTRKLITQASNGLHGSLNALASLDPSLVNVRGDGKWTALLAATAHTMPQTVQALLHNGADVNAANALGWTPLLLACDVDSNSSGDLVRLLLEAQADVEARKQDGSTALSVAAAKGHTAIVDMLLSHGADPQTSNSLAWTPLQLAAKGGHVDTLRVLVDAGADVNAVRRGNWTALTHAARENQPQVLNLLLQAGADTETRTYESKTALMYAVECGSSRMVEMLVEAGADLEAQEPHSGCTALLLAASAPHGSAETVKELLEGGAEVDARSARGETALLHAVRVGYGARVEVLLQAGADPNEEVSRQDSRHPGYTAVELAAALGMADTVESLWEAGADINHIADDGHSVHSLATLFRFNGILDLLHENTRSVRLK